MFKYHKRTRQLTSSNQPITCLSDQQAGHVTHRTTSASKYSSQGLSQQLSNIQVRRAIKGNTLIYGGNIQQAEFNTKDSCKIALAIGYRVYQPVPATQPCTLASTTGYRVYRMVLATQSCTLASTTGCRVYRPVPATQPCTLASTTGYRVYRLVLATQPCTLASTYRLQSLLTGCWLHSPYCTVLHPNLLHI